MLACATQRTGRRCDAGKNGESDVAMTLIGLAHEFGPWPPSAEDEYGWAAGNISLFAAGQASGTAWPCGRTLRDARFLREIGS